MSRWSPTVVATAAPAVRSPLATALDVGMGVYRDQREQRQQEALRQRQQQWHDEEQAQQNAWHTDEVNYRNGITERADFDRLNTLHKEGARDGLPPTDDPDGDNDLATLRAAAEKAQQNGAAPAPPATEGVAPTDPNGPVPNGGGAPLVNAQPSSPRAGNAGPGGSPSEAVPRWYTEGMARIKERSRQQFPNGSGYQRIRSPGANGQDMYFPVKDQWEAGERAKLDAELAKEQQTNAATTLNEQRDAAKAALAYKQSMDLADRNGMWRLREAQARGGAGAKAADPEAELNTDFEKSRLQKKQAVNDLQENQKALMAQAKLLDGNTGNPKEVAALIRQANAMGQQIQAATHEEEAMGTSDARAQFRNQRIAKDSTAAVGELMEQPVGKGCDPLRALLSPYSFVDPKTKAMMAAELEKQKAAIGGNLRKRYGGSSALARALNPMQK